MIEDFSYPDVSVLAAPIYVALIALEWTLINAHRLKGRYERRDAIASMSLGFGNAASGIVFASTIYAFFTAILLFFYEFRLFDLHISIGLIVIVLLIDDFFYYWGHRFGHTVRWFWANHFVHHSSTHFNLSTALRQPWFSFLTGLFVLKIPMVLLGVHPGIIAFVGSVNLFYQFFIHTEVVDKLPRPIEYLFNTPSHHRVHHGRNARYLDANYGGVLIIWDRLFGSFVPELKEEPVDYGTVQHIGTQNPFRIAIHEYLALWQDISAPGKNLRHRLLHLAARPGWQPTGESLTSRELKQAFIAEHPSCANSPGLPYDRS